MKSRHSSSLILIWRIAEFEARHLNASMIEPTHLLLGLCKVVDLDLPEMVSRDSPDRDEVLEELLREVRKLRTVFRAAGLATFREAQLWGTGCEIHGQEFWTLIPREKESRLGLLTGCEGIFYL